MPLVTPCSLGCPSGIWQVQLYTHNSRGHSQWWVCIGLRSISCPNPATFLHRWADNFSAAGCGGTEEHSFQHPFLQVRPQPGAVGHPAGSDHPDPPLPQAVGMFLGEFSCLAVFYLLLWRDRRRPEPSMAPSQPFSPLLFLPPALCDMTGTSIMYVGECWGEALPL